MNMTDKIVRNTLFTILLAASLSGISRAEEKAVEVPPPPVIPEGFDEDDSIQADVTIRKGKDKVIEEFRVNGALYMVRITPKIGKPYYLRYPEGEKGRVIRKELDDINTPFWKLFEW
jgi:hypothetical protein